MKYDEHGAPAARGAVKRSKAGPRTVALPPVTVQALRAHRKRQLEKRVAVGPLWTDHGLVFANDCGEPIHLAHVRRTFARIGKRAGIEGADFTYLLRHALYKHYRHKVRPVADAGLRMLALLVAADAT